MCEWVKYEGRVSERRISFMFDRKHRLFIRQDTNMKALVSFLSISEYIHNKCLAKMI